MFALLASFVFLAAGEPLAPPLLTDAEVPRYLSPVELSEWKNSLVTAQRGQTRLNQANSVLSLIRPGTTAAPGIPVPGYKGPTNSNLTETVEQRTMRAQKMLDEGNAILAGITPSLAKLRSAASARAAELTKPLQFAAELTQVSWSAGVATAVAALQMKASEAGFKQVHVVGAFTLLADGKIQRPPALLTELRSAWAKQGAATLAVEPLNGYAYGSATGAQGVPTLSKGLRAPTSIRQAAVVWAELYSLSADSSQALLFVRLADAYTMRLVASEVVLTGVAATTPLATQSAGSLVLRDERSFIPRLAGAGDWIFGFDSESVPLAAAIMTHLVTRHSQLGTAASSFVVVAIGGDAPGTDGARAKWKLLPSKVELARAVFTVTATPTGAEPVAVGTLTWSVEEPARPATQR